MAEWVALALEAIGEYFGTEMVFTAGELLTISEVIVAAAAVYSSEQQRLSAQHRANDAFARSQRDRYVMVRNALEPRRIVMGTRRTSGPMVFVGSYGVDREHLVYAVPLAGHELASIGTVYFNDEPVVLDGSGNVLAILRTDQFSISTPTDTFTLTTDPQAGSVTATAYYGSDVVVLTVGTITGRSVPVSGARSGEVGQVDVSYYPSPNPYKPTHFTDAMQDATGTGASQNVTLDHAPLPGSTFAVEQTGGETGDVALSVSVSGSVVTFTASGANNVHITYQWADNNASLARVRKYLGRMDQAADAGMISALPGIWTSDHRMAGCAYLVVELDYDREAFSGGEPSVSAVVQGLKCYDPRKNLALSPLMDGAAIGAPGTLPTGWTRSVTAGLSSEVIGFGTDELTGWSYIDVKVTGTTTGSGAVFVTPVPFAGAPTAAPGQKWAARAMVRQVDGAMAWGDWAYARLQVVSYNSGGSPAVETYATISPAAASGKQDPIEAADASLASGSVKAGMRLALGYGTGLVVDCTFRFMLPQLWHGELGDSADPFVYTANPVLHAYGYATAPLGGRLPWNQVDIPWLESEANACDTAATYTVGGKDYERALYTSGYIALTSQKPTDVLTDICAGMAGEWVYVDGYLRLKAGVWHAPVLAIDESWLQGDQAVEIQVAQERDQLVNCLRGTFFDARQDYRATPFPPIEPQAYIDADKGKLPLEVEYGSIDFVGQAQFVAAIRLRGDRQGMVVKLKCNYRAWQAQTFDNVTLSLARFGFVDKPFTVQRDAFTLDGGIELVLRETDASVFDMDAEFTAIDAAPNSRLPDPWGIDPITGLAADSGTDELLLQADGTIISRVHVTWDAVDDPRITDSTGSIEIWWKDQGADEWQVIKRPGDSVDAFISPAQDGHYVLIKARALGSVGMSEFCTQIMHQVVGKTAPPVNVAGLLQHITYGAIILEWTMDTELDYRETELRRGSSWAAGVPLKGTAATIIQGNRYAWEWPDDGTYTVYAKHRDTSGNESTTATTVSVVVDYRIHLTESYYAYVAGPVTYSNIG